MYLPFFGIASELIDQSVDMWCQKRTRRLFLVKDMHHESQVTERETTLDDEIFTKSVFRVFQTNTESANISTPDLIRGHEAGR